jgi:hypothetical protein
MLFKVLSQIGSCLDTLPCLASKLKKCCEMRAISMVAAGTLQGCMHTSIAHQSYPLSPPLGAPFFATAQKEAVALYAGYGYSLSTFEIFAFDLEKRSIIARKQYNVEGVKLVCESSEGIVLSRLENSLLVSYQSGALVIQRAPASCPDPRAAIICSEGRTLFHGWLPGRREQLSICYIPDIRITTFHITSEGGIRRDLGASGTSPNGSGGFVVTRGVQPGTFLAHHTRNAIPESAVLVDAEAGTVQPFSLPDLSVARPSRGFGAGSFGVTLHPVLGGIVAEGEGGDVFLLKGGNARLLTANAVAQSVRIGVESCAVTLVARTQAGEEFRVYGLCGR